MNGPHKLTKEMVIISSYKVLNNKPNLINFLIRLHKTSHSTQKLIVFIKNGTLSCKLK